MITIRLRIETIRFRRFEHSPWERGITVNEGSGPIIDMHGHVVSPPVHDYQMINDTVLTVLDRLET